MFTCMCLVRLFEMRVEVASGRWSAKVDELCSRSLLAM